MKTFFVVIKTSSLLIGAVIGAGFVSGRESVIFFNNNYLILSCLITCVLFFLGFYLFLSLGQIYKNQTLLNKQLFPKTYNIVNIIIVISMLLILSTLLASLDVLFYEEFTLFKNIPFYSIIMLVLAFIFSQKNISKLTLISSIIVPIIIIVLLTFLILNQNYSLEVKVNKTPLLNVLFYVGLNLFFSSAIIIKSGEKLSKKECLYSSIIASIVLSILMFLLSASIRYIGANAFNAEFPFFYLIKQNKFIKTIFFILMSLAIFTSLIATYYPLNFYFRERLGDGGAYTLLILSFLLSRVGFKKIIAIFYPSFGFLGLIYLIVILITLMINRKTTKYKIISFADNSK